MIVYIEIYNVDKERKCYVLFEQTDEYNINLDTKVSISIDVIKNKLTHYLNIEILDNELIYLGYDNDKTHFWCLQTFLRKKHIIKLKKYIKNINDNNVKITYFRNKKKLNKLFLYDMKLYSLYRKFMIYQSIKYDIKELGLI